MEQELNKKLAEWAGLRLWVDGDPLIFAPPEGGGDEAMLCDFTQSLDACFKWLVPKLYHIDIVANPYNNVIIVGIYADKTGKAYRVTVCNKVDEASVAFGLCRAIEKLIDKEVQGD